MGVNKAILLGNVGADPRIDYPEKGSVFATFTLATNEHTASGERTEWHRLVMSGRNAELAEKYIRKGTRLYVEGKIRTRQYTDKTGINRYVTEIYVDNFELLGRVVP